MKRIILFCLAGSLLMATTGCGLLQAVFNYRPCVTRGTCGGCGECDDCDGASCGPVRRGHAPVRRAMACNDCDDGSVGCGRPCRRAAGCLSCESGCDSCDPCADPCGSGSYGRCWYRGPLSCIFALFTPRCWGGSGCGERYWGDFYSDPPDCWDPCDGQGNYAGDGSMQFHGGHSNGGCRNCGGGHHAHSANAGPANEGMMTDEQVVSDRVVSPAMKPAQPHKAVRRQ